MVVIILLLSVCLIAFGSHCTRLIWKGRQASPQLGDIDRDVQNVKHCFTGVTSFIAAIFLALTVVSPKYLHATGGVMHLATILVLLGFAGWMVCQFIGVQSLRRVLRKKIFGRKAP